VVKQSKGYKYHSRANFLAKMEFTETYEILVKIPKDSGSLSERFLFYVTAGIFHDSLSFYLQYGRKSQQFLMHVRACSSRAINLQSEL